MATISYVSLRFVGDRVDAATITQLLELEPSHSGAKGDTERRGPGGREYTLQTNTWTYDSPLETTETLESHLRSILSVLESKTDALSQLSAQGYSAELNSTVFWDQMSGRLTITADTLRRIGLGHINLVVDVFAAEDPSEVT